MISHTFLLITITCAAFAFPANAREVSLTIDNAVAQAIRHNPALAAARLRIEEAHGRLDGAGLRPNPELEWELSQNVRSLEHGVGIAWVQKFPRTARLTFEKAVSRAELTAATAEVRDAERRLAGEVRTAAVGLLALEKERGLRDQQIANSDELAAFMNKRVQAGETAAVDAAQVELESKQLRTQILMLNAEKATLLGTLRPLLGVSDSVKITGTLAEPGASPAKGAPLSARGDYRAAQANAEAARQGVELAKANKWEDITVGVSAERVFNDDVGHGIERELMVGLRVNMPLPLRNKNEGKIREALALAKRTENEVEAVAAQARAEATAARAEMDTLAKIVAEIDEKLIPAATQIEEQLRTNYDAGLTPLPEVIRARGKRFELEAQRLDALRDYHLARVKHQTATGAGSPAAKRKETRPSR